MASRALSLKLRYGLSLVSIVPPSCVFTLESYSSLYITIRPLRGRRERDSGDYLPPRQGPPETPPGALPLDPASKNLYLKGLPVPQTPAEGTTSPLHSPMALVGWRA